MSYKTELHDRLKGSRLEALTHTLGHVGLCGGASRALTETSKVVPQANPEPLNTIYYTILCCTIPYCVLYYTILYYAIPYYFVLNAVVLY